MEDPRMNLLSYSFNSRQLNSTHQLINSIQCISIQLNSFHFNFFISTVRHLLSQYSQLLRRVRSGSSYCSRHGCPSKLHGGLHMPFVQQPGGQVGGGCPAATQMKPTLSGTPSIVSPSSVFPVAYALYTSHASPSLHVIEYDCCFDVVLVDPTAIAMLSSNDTVRSNLSNKKPVSAVSENPILSVLVTVLVDCHWSPAVN